MKKTNYHRMKPNQNIEISTDRPSNSWNKDQATILSAMEYITQSCEAIPLTKEEWEVEDEESLSIDEAIAYLEDRLGLTRVQVLIVSYVFLYMAEHPNSMCDTEDLSRLMRINALRLLRLSPDIALLEEKGYIVSTNTPQGDLAWRTSNEVRDAFMQDRAPDMEATKLQSNFDFLCIANHIIKEGRRFDHDGRIVRDISQVMKRNPHLPIVKSLKKLKKEEDRWFILSMMTTLAAEGDEYVNVRDIEQILPGRIVRKIFSDMRRNNHIFDQKKYVLNYNQDGMMQANQWILSREAWLDMLGSEEEVEMVCPEKEDNLSPDLISYSQIASKELYFSGNTKQQVDRLSELLKDEQYERICEALKKRGMPTGLCCLFYGLPGTGKTELVQQLAIATQRNIMQVDLSSLRDKYVGESEKRIKHIFDKYRAHVRKEERAPILFFNEADGIFGNRMENTQRSVDKMENTLQNIILQEMEHLEGILICTTNLTTCLDKAFDRRFLFKIEFEQPTNEARKLIWQSMLEGLNDEQASYLAERFNFSGGQIQNISRKQIINAIFSGKDEIDYEQVKIDCQNETISRNNGSRIGF